MIRDHDLASHVRHLERMLQLPARNRRDAELLRDHIEGALRKAEWLLSQHKGGT